MVDDEKDLGQAFGAVLKNLRTEKGLSQMKLAADAELHLNAVSKIERGEQIPSLSTVFSLARALGVAPSTVVAAVENTCQKRAFLR